MAKPYRFKAVLQIIGINPFVFVPQKILQSIFKEAGRDKGSIRVKGSINNNAFQQSLVKYAGSWRLYINLKMLPQSTKRIGEVVDVTIQFNAEYKTLPLHKKLKAALVKNEAANNIFNSQPPSLQNEINRYITNLKTEESVDRNIARAIDFLLGKTTFVGRSLSK